MKMATQNFIDREFVASSFYAGLTLATTASLLIPP